MGQSSRPAGACGPGAFAFGSRRVRIADLPAAIRDSMDEKESDDPEYIAAYNRWAAGHEAILAKSLLSARTIGPAVAAGIFSDIWVYIVATIVGGVLAGVLYKYYLEEA